MDREAWWATVHKVTKSRTRLSDSAAADRPLQQRHPHEGMKLGNCVLGESRRMCDAALRVVDGGLPTVVPLS